MSERGGTRRRRRRKEGSTGGTDGKDEVVEVSGNRGARRLGFIPELYSTLPFTSRKDPEPGRIAVCCLKIVLWI